MTTLKFKTNFTKSAIYPDEWYGVEGLAHLLIGEGTNHFVKNMSKIISSTQEGSMERTSHIHNMDLFLKSCQKMAKFHNIKMIGKEIHFDIHVPDNNGLKITDIKSLKHFINNAVNNDVSKNKIAYIESGSAIYARIKNLNKTNKKMLKDIMKNLEIIE